jgi:hypothetical protein
MVERLWAATTERALRLPKAVQRERVGGEWSIVETLRSLHRARPRRPRSGRGLGFLTALTATRRDDRGAVDSGP